MSDPVTRVASADTSTPEAPAGYEAPRIEQVLTQDKLQQESLYAGPPSPLEW